MTPVTTSTNLKPGIATVLIIALSCGMIEARVADSASQSPLLSPYELNECATRFAEGLRKWHRETAPAGPVRLLMPEWSSTDLKSLPEMEPLVLALVRKINSRSGAAVAFEVNRAASTLLWRGENASIYATRLVVSKSGKKNKANLVFSVYDARRGRTLFESEYGFRMPQRKNEGADAPERAAPEAQGEDSPTKRESSAPPTESEGRPIRQQDAPPRSRTSIDDEDIERVVELSCGRLYYLDKKSARRIVRVSDRCMRDATDIFIAEIDLVCTRSDREVKLWGSFLDSNGRIMAPVRPQKLTLREGRIRTVTFESALPVHSVRIFLEKD